MTKKLRTIHENLYGNWYGYVDGKRATNFFNTSTSTQEEAAHAWATEGPHRVGRVHRSPADGAACAICKTVAQ